jgi:TonB family protein
MQPPYNVLRNQMRTEKLENLPISPSPGNKMLRSITLLFAAVAFAALIPTSLCHAEPSSYSNVFNAYSSQVLAVLERNKHFPSEGKGVSGVVEVGFKIDRFGHLLSTEIVKSSGFPALDRAAIATIERSQPFPIPPSEVISAGLNFSIPMTFKTIPASRR